MRRNARGGGEACGRTLDSGQSCKLICPCTEVYIVALTPEVFLRS